MFVRWSFDKWLENTSANAALSLYSRCSARSVFDHGDGNTKNAGLHARKCLPAEDDEVGPVAENVFFEVLALECDVAEIDAQMNGQGVTGNSLGWILFRSHYSQQCIRNESF